MGKVQTAAHFVPIVVKNEGNTVDAMRENEEKNEENTAYKIREI